MSAVTRRVSTVLAVLLGTACSVLAQPTSTPAVIGYSVSLESRILNETRTILIYTPPSYDDTDEQYPVLYLLDADNTFHYATGIIDFLVRVHHIPELLVVGITSSDRNRDLTPEPGERDKERFPTSGGADNFLRFLQEEVMPYIDSEYRTRSYRVMVGHSLGGLFAVHALFTKPDAFNAVIASSPSLYWNNRAVLSNAESFLQNRNSFNRSLLITVGSERDEIVTSAQELSHVLDRYAPPDLSWQFDNMPNEDHSTIPFAGLRNGLEFIFSDFYQVERLYSVGFHDYCSRLEAKYGYQLPLPLGFVYGALEHYADNRIFGDAIDVLEYMFTNYNEVFMSEIRGYVEVGNQLVDGGQYEYAIRLFQLLVGADDSLFDAYKGMANAYLLSGDKEAALREYRRALDINPDDQEAREKVRVIADDR